MVITAEVGLMHTDGGVHHPVNPVFGGRITRAYPESLCGHHALGLWLPLPAGERELHGPRASGLPSRLPVPFACVLC